ncbi:hypothetical protein ACIRVF_39050 [Kitasatospora sp. NPDC101157]|uniref:hypothetical protein n=1 Tax=Kitasatospora sp. NPDC101157 TaxID=3364098 RepID=UPI003808B8B7
MHPSRPLLALDVDGVLSPYGAGRLLPGYVPHQVRPQAWVDWSAMVYPRPSHLVVQLNPAIGERLEALPFDLVWVSAWTPQELAAMLGPLGFTQAPPHADLKGATQRTFFLRVDDPGVSPDAKGDLWWRSQDVLGWANRHDRPLAWLAPHFPNQVRRDFADGHAAPALLHEVDPAAGLTDADFTALTTWAEKVAALELAPAVVPRRCRDCGDRSTTVIAGRREDRVHAACGSCCECYCPIGDGSDAFQACGDLESERCAHCGWCRVCGCGC